MKEVKRIRGHGLGTNMDWLCILHKNEGFGFGKEEAITCIDMTVHAPEHGRPNTIFSTYKHQVSRQMVKRKIIKGAYRSSEQIEMAHNIINNWDEIKDNELIEIDEKITEEELEWAKEGSPTRGGKARKTPEWKKPYTEEEKQEIYKKRRKFLHGED